MLHGRDKLRGRFRWTLQRGLTEVVFIAVRDALQSCPHPDSKRQARRKARDLERHGARILKASNVTVQLGNNHPRKRREIKELVKRHREEQAKFARECAARLLGRGKRAA